MTRDQIGPGPAAVGIEQARRQFGPLFAGDFCGEG
jgi:hypothetical protein